MLDKRYVIRRNSYAKFETGYRQRRQFAAMEWGLIFVMLSMVHVH
jgi:hypothetical protein